MSLDPENWEEFRLTAHDVLDKCINRMQSSSDLPWRAPDSKLKETSGLPLPQSGSGYEMVAEALTDRIMPYATGNTHPRFFGWVHGTGTAVSLLAEMTASAMNSNCGGRDHGAVYIERQVVDWCKEIFQYPTTAGGLLTSGTSMSTLLALAVARNKVLGTSSRQTGIKPFPQLKVYAAQGTHHCLHKTLEVLGIGSRALTEIPIDLSTGSISIKGLTKAIEQDLKNDLTPMCIVGNAGSVDTGRFDDFTHLYKVCQKFDVWFHIDGAFGAWITLADERWAGLAHGIDLADSLAFDFHKWMYVQYDAGALLVKDEGMLLDTFGERPDYLEGNESGLAGGDPWYCEKGIELSRGFKALKVWSTLQCYGLDKLGEHVSRNCEQAHHMGRLIEEAEELDLTAPVTSNVCCFKVSDSITRNHNLTSIHKQICTKLQNSGSTVLSTTLINGESSLRAAIVNHRTSHEDIEDTVRSVSMSACEIVKLSSHDMTQE